MEGLRRFWTWLGERPPGRIAALIPRWSYALILAALGIAIIAIVAPPYPSRSSTVADADAGTTYALCRQMILTREDALPDQCQYVMADICWNLKQSKLYIPGHPQTCDVYRFGVGESQGP